MLPYINPTLRFHGPIIDSYEITEFTSIGQYLYRLASLPEVNLFLETGASTGGSSRCIATGLSQSDGHLHTFEASISRFRCLLQNLAGLPFTAYNESSVHVPDISNYYQQLPSEFIPASGMFSSLLMDLRFDACFLDSINLCQLAELQIVVASRIRHILMHEPDHKCPGYDSYLLKHGYQLINASRDIVDRQAGNSTPHLQPLWVHYQLTDYPRPGSL